MPKRARKSSDVPDQSSADAIAEEEEVEPSWEVEYVDNVVVAETVAGRGKKKRRKLSEQDRPSGQPRFWKDEPPVALAGDAFPSGDVLGRFFRVKPYKWAELDLYKAFECRDHPKRFFGGRVTRCGPKC